MDAHADTQHDIELLMVVDFCFKSKYNSIMFFYNKNLINLARANRKAGNLAEALLWHELKKNKLGLSFVRQQTIGNYIADFYCREKKLVIEIDGSSHDDKYKYDKARDEYMKKLGMRVLRISDKDVKHDMPNVLIWIKYNIDNPLPSSTALPHSGGEP